MRQPRAISAAVRYALNQWQALTRFLDDGDLEIDNGATERANRDIALGALVPILSGYKKARSSQVECI